MAIDRIRGSGVLDGTIGTADIADDAVTGAKIENNPTIAGTLGVTGDLTVDTSTLKVNASNNYIGIGTASPQKKIHILDTTSDGNMIFDRNGTSTDHQIVFAHNYQSGGQSGGNYYGIGVDGSENKLVFAFDANSQASLSADAKMTLNSSGVLSVPSGVELGLNFAGAASNTLDDYEEGTFTAQISTDSTYTGETQSGVYTKIGDIVFIQIRFQRSGTLNSGSNARFSLPFTAANNGVQASGFRGSVENIDTSMIGIGGTIAANGTILYLNEMTAATTGHNVNGNDLGANFQVQIQGFYKTA